VIATDYAQSNPGQKLPESLAPYAEAEVGSSYNPWLFASYAEAPARSGAEGARRAIAVRYVRPRPLHLQTDAKSVALREVLFGGGVGQSRDGFLYSIKIQRRE